MIMLGNKKSGSIVANIRDKMEGKGMSHDDLKYDHEKQEQADDSENMELAHAAGKIIDAIRGDDVKSMEHALKSFIELCTKNR